MAGVDVKKNPSISRKEVPPPPPARPKTELDKSWWEADSINLSDEKYDDDFINGADYFQKRAIEELTKKFNERSIVNQDLQLAINIIKNLKVK